MTKRLVEADWPAESKAVMVMRLYPPSRVTLAVKLPAVSLVTICSLVSDRTTTEARGEVLPVTETEFWVVRSSSAGAEIFRGMEEGEVSGVGVGETCDDGAGEGEILARAAAWRRLLLAVEIPNVITRPTAMPISMASATSFFISHG